MGIDGDEAPMFESIRKRRGRVRISKTMLVSASLDLLRSIFGHLVIVRAELSFMSEIIEYDAYSEWFDEVEDYEIGPLYSIAIRRQHGEDREYDFMISVNRMDEVKGA